MKLIERLTRPEFTENPEVRIVGYGK